MAQLDPAVRTGLRMNRDLLPTGTSRKAGKRHDIGHTPWLPHTSKYMSKEAHEKGMDNAQVTSTYSYYWRKDLQQWFDNYTTKPNGNTSGAPGHGDLIA